MTQVETTQEGRYHVWTIGDRLRIARESVTQSQGVFAEITGISRNTVSRYEGDRTTHRKPYVIKTWADTTGFSYAWLLTGEAPVTGTVTQGNQMALELDWANYLVSAGAEWQPSLIAA